MTPAKPSTSSSDRPENLTDRIYSRLRQDICGFQLIPGERFTETEIANRMQASRTPVREALNRLQQNGFVEVHFRSGWQVKSFDLPQFEQLYDVRTILELATVDRLCAGAAMPILDRLAHTWFTDPANRLTDPVAVCALDESFHGQLVEASGNTELARIHQDITERIRIIRHLDFTQQARVDITYEEHAEILHLILDGKANHARALLRTHIEDSKAEIRKITLHMLQKVRSGAA
ncbi:GntR family transcriptional regulator [Luteolibacter pohnpeiensis]|uniref:GntR family transcriptional regulator n=1 Tax=Luteolibacter pohnpeiensis TaxID=454153 RepID=A0A934SD90_9BACT|nr:GntR family transcriptional regulator [Luteolibacter pohnpeiensis]MBK1883113.1 GntR family transcriptional regulator [Luteolibacter pohnpeiensis]